MKKFFYSILICALAACDVEKQKPIDREALVTRNNPQVSAFDSLASLSVGNGEFAFTVDVTGLQTFPERYSEGVPLGTQSQWGWHRFPNPQNYRPEDVWKEFDFGRGHKELYACQFKEPGRRQDASDWLRINPHRLHLGVVGLELGDSVKVEDLANVQQSLDMWKGTISSRFTLNCIDYEVQTVCHPTLDMISARIADTAHSGINLRFPYPTGRHSDDACDWTADDKHTTEVVSRNAQCAVLKRTLDETSYYVALSWEGKARLSEKARNYFVLIPEADTLAFSCRFTSVFPATMLKEGSERPVLEALPTFEETSLASAAHWKKFWTDGAAVDFSRCTAPGAKELERRVVLSQVGRQLSAAGNGFDL